jgi:DNA-binding NtrC family response regulator
VRELKAAVERTVLLGEVDDWREMESETRPHAFDPSVAFRVAKERAITAWESEYLSALMAHAGGNVSLASRTVRMDRNHLRELLARHQLKVSRS